MLRDIKYILLIRLSLILILMRYRSILNNLRRLRCSPITCLQISLILLIPTRAQFALILRLPILSLSLLLPNSRVISTPLSLILRYQSRILISHRCVIHIILFQNGLFNRIFQEQAIICGLIELILLCGRQIVILL